MDGNRSIGAMVGTVLSRPDEIMLAAGASGELLVARLRLVLTASLLLLPLANTLAGGEKGESLIGFGAAIVVNVFAMLWLLLAHRSRHYRWLPFATAAFDVTATTSVLALLGSQHLSAALNSMVVWCLYVLAILMTALRSDGRITLFAGLLALLQYGALNAAVFAIASPEQLVSPEYGAVTRATQIQRLILLALTTALTATIVYRMQRLVHMSGIDGLTRLPNRTWLMHRMPRLLEAAHDQGLSLSLALIDLDNFKAINAEGGHRMGDRVLCHLARVLQDGLEENEWLVRLGGQELVVVMPLPVGAAWERMEALRRWVAAHPFDPGPVNDEPIRVTLSAGIAASPQDGRDTSHLLGRADRRLKIAKREGRNRVVVRDD